MKNPFRQGTISYTDWETLKDLKWHCTKCELKTGQAKTWQTWIHQKGIQFDSDGKVRLMKTIFCNNCQNKTTHRKLKSLEILDQTKARSPISKKLKIRIKKLYDNEEALFLRKLSSRELEIDHKFPQVRWSTNEQLNSPDMSDKEIKAKFILLTRSNNLLKSRYCENCFKTGNRGHFPGIYFWYRGNKKWQGKTKYDESGCVGCFWYDPYQWRIELNKLVNK